jgi:hypothetical protein
LRGLQNFPIGQDFSFDVLSFFFTFFGFSERSRIPLEQIVLIFTHLDVFEQDLPKTPLHKVFPEYKDNDSTLDDLEFLRKQFLFAAPRPEQVMTAALNLLEKEEFEAGFVFLFDIFFCCSKSLSTGIECCLAKG